MKAFPPTTANWTCPSEPVTVGAAEAVTPIITDDPDTFKALEPKVPIVTESSDLTSRIGNPEISFTDIKDPENESITENNWPCAPSTSNKASVGDAEPDLVITREPELIAKVAGDVADAPATVTEDVPTVNTGLLY